MITDYASLQTTVADFLNRDDLTAAVPTFIALGESNIARDLRHWRQERRVVGPTNWPFETLPFDFLELIDIYAEDGTQLSQIPSPEFGSRKAAATPAGTPCYYRMSAGEIEFYPTPAPDTPITLRYYARIPALTDEHPTNWLLEHAPDVHLYGALMHTAPYLQHDERITTWAALYSAAVQQLNTQSKRAQHRGPPLVMKVR